MKVDYQKTIIYKLCCKDPTIKDIYVGHTINFKQRNYKHKSASNNPNSNEYNDYKYKFIRDNGGYSNWNMIIVKDYPCNNKRDAEKEENRIMIELGSTLNSNKSYVSKEEKKEYYKQHNKNYYPNYYQENRTEKLEKMKVKVNCEYCNCLSTKSHLKRHQKTQKCIKIQNDTFKN